MALLEIRNLTVEFPTLHGAFRAVDSVDLTVDAREIVAIVGESGSGKSVSMLAVMDLLPWTARVTADRLDFAGRSLLGLSAAQRRRIVGKDMAMIFQEPMTSLNPCFTVGFQLIEGIRVHEGGARAERRRRALELLDLVGIPAPARLSAPALGRYEPAGHDRHGDRVQPPPPDRRRADHRAGCDHPGADPGSVARAAKRARHGADPDHPRHGGGRPDRAAGGCAIRPPAGRDPGRAGAVRPSPAPPHGGPAARP